MTENDDKSICRSKFYANGMQYFKLFEKHIPTGIECNVLLVSIGNPDCISYIINLNPNAIYYVYDSVYVNNILSYNNRFKITFNNLDNDNLEHLIDSIDMKFDCIIMNPPYQKNLHLKILAEAIKHLKDNGTCVSLQPDNWLTNPFKQFEKERDKREAPAKIGKYIQDYDSVSQEDFNNLFGTNNWFGVGVFKLGNKETAFDTTKWDNKDKLLLKVLSKIYSLPSLRSQYTKRTNKLFFVPCRRTSHGYLNYCEIDDSKVNAKDGIQFNNAIEVKNFKDSILNTWLYKWLETTLWQGSENSAEVPFMSDYSQPWDDVRFYKFFNITPEEQKIIEDTLKKYEAK